MAIAVRKLKTLNAALGLRPAVDPSSQFH